MRVSLLVTCLGDALFPDVGVATVRLLRRLGVEVDFPGAQTCCGQPFFNSGYHDAARELARHTIQAFANGQWVVTPSGSCAAMVKLEYPELFHEDHAWHERARGLAERTCELSDFLVNVLKVEDVGARFEGKATYHMACHLRGLGVYQEPVQLLERVRGLELVPLERFDECCGFGGSFAVRYPNISGAMVQDKAAAIEKAGVDAVIATDAGCLMNVAGCLRRRGGRTHDVDHRHMLGVRAGDRVDRAQLADPERGAHGAEAADARVSVGGVPGAELVGAADPLDRRMLLDVVEHRQREVARHPEQVVDAGFAEAVEQVAGDVRFPHAHIQARGCRGGTGPREHPCERAQAHPIAAARRARLGAETTTSSPIATAKTSSTVVSGNQSIAAPNISTGTARPT